MTGPGGAQFVDSALMSTPRKVSQREVRHVVNNQGALLEQHHDVLQKLIHDELRTRGRVDALEAFRGMTFRQRLVWLFRGWQ
jgi:hypothetical protein